MDEVEFGIMQESTGETEWVEGWTLGNVTYDDDDHFVINPWLDDNRTILVIQRKGPLSPDDEDDSSVVSGEEMYPSSLGILLAVPEWEAALTAVSLSLIILLTVVGNVLVILSVFTYRPLRIVPNFFLVSLAVADLTVAILVLPFNVAYSILGRWVFGIVVCEMWLTCDVLCCTASILNLCAIALDRYWAITDPINYAQKRTLKRVLWMIVVVWVASGIISSPPLVGWNDWPEFFTDDTPCMLTEERGYVLYSAFGSFYIPLLIMTIVYLKIFLATRRRLRERAKASKLNTVKQFSTVMSKDHNSSTKVKEKEERDSTSSETNPNDEDGEKAKLKSKAKRARKKKQDAPPSHGQGITQETSLQQPQPQKQQFLQAGQQLDPSHLQSFTISEDSVTDNDRKEGGGSGGSGSGGTVQNNCVQKTTSTPVSQFIEERQRISLSKERKAARTLGIIMGVFMMCWLPFFLMYVIIPFCPRCPLPSRKVVNFITWLGYINSALNPIIYTIFNMDFRRAFKRLLRFNR